MHVMGSVSPANESEGVSLQVEGIPVVMPTSPPHCTSSRFSDITDNQTRSPDLPSLPPPALLPPPPPPPPPLLALIPGLGNPVAGLRKKKRVRSFFWKTIPEEQVKGRPNLWTQGRVQGKYQIDVQTIEELFGQSNDSTASTRVAKTRSSFREAKEEFSILDSKRGMNIGIFLKQFKRPNETIVDDIRHGNSESFGAEPLRELLKLLPEMEEVEKLTAFRGDISKLPLADSFMYLLIQLPSYSVRIESMLLKEEFPGSCAAMKRDIEILRSATKELMCCEELHAVLHLVLQAGNILNAGGYAGNAVGFKLSSLLSLADTKANKPGMNLLHFVALEAQKKDERLLEFPLKLGHVQAAARISLETLDAELHWLTSRTRSVEENVQRDTELLQQLDDFLQHATSSLCSLRGSRLQLKKEGSELIDFFCEDRDSFRLDDCFSIFNSFCCRFADAVKENKDREVKEAVRRRRIQELEDQKRHSWAGGEVVGGAFGLRCSSETDMSAAFSRHDEASLLMELLTPKSHHRSPLNSPLGSSGSVRRSRNSPSSSPSVAAECELSMLLEMATDRKVNQQRGRGEARTAFPLASPNHHLIKDIQTVPNAPSALTKTSWSPETVNHATNTYLSFDATHPGYKPTSDSNQQSDHNNNATNGLGVGLSSQATSGMNNSQTERSTGTTGNMSVVLKKCTLVPELKAFESTTLSSGSKVHHTSCHQNDMIITDVEEEGAEKTLKMQSNSNQTAEESHLQITEASEEDEGREGTVVVWCVTGVCEAAEDTHNTFAQSDADQCRGDNVGVNQQESFVPVTHRLSEPKPANEKTVPVPISSQPVPVSRCDESSLPASSPRWRPAEPGSTTPPLTTDASEEDKVVANQGEVSESSTNEKSDVTSVPEQSPDTTKTPSSHSNNKNVGETCSTQPSSKISTKNLPTSKTQTKPTTSDKSKPIRTLTNTENHGMRRVVPIYKTSRSTSSLIKCPEKPTPHVQGTSGTAVHNNLTVSNANSTALRRGERPATAPSSRRSSIHKTSDPKELKDQKVSGTGLSVRDQNQDLQRKPSFQKLVKKPKAQVEEKICRSTLRALGGGGGGSISAPATPLHKDTTSPSSARLPGFARSTASSSFRRTNTVLAPSVPAPNSSPKTTTTSSSIHPHGASLGFTRTGSLRVSSRSSDAFNASSSSSSSSTLIRSHSIRTSPRSPLHDSLTPPKGNQRNDSSNLKDSGKASRPIWR